MIRRLRFSLSWSGWIALGFFACLAALFLSWPIFATDYDLWYHMSGGAQIVKNMHLPEGAFFSFVPGDPTWVVYYWFFQIIVYGIHQASGYYGLIAMRAILLVTACWFIYRYVHAEDRDDNAAAMLALLLTGFYTLALLPRELNLRPHGFTYLLMILFHYIVNHRPRWAWALPVLGLLWVNVHGMLYPIMLFICGAYLAEHFAARLFRFSEREALRAARWPLIVSLYTVLATPAGLGLLGKPFHIAPFSDRFIMEAFPMPWDKFLNFFLSPRGPMVDTATNLLVVFLVVSLVVLAVEKRLRISRLLLAAGGLYLLPQAQRYYYEFILLCLPLAGDVVALAAKRQVRALPVKLAAGFAGAMLLLTLSVTNAFLGRRPHYPLDFAKVPIGVCDFLEKEGPGGRVLNTPTPGGYLQWRLYPKYRIFCDMQAILFTPTEYFQALNMVTDKTVLRHLVDQYAPGFILAYNTDTPLKETLADFPQYVQVFFDDMLVLYADAKQYPDLAKRFQLETLSAFSWQSDDYETMEPQQRDKALAECHRLLSVYPDGIVANTIAAKILLAEGHTAEAAIHADVVIRNFPDKYMGYALRALAAFKEERYDAALAYNQMAMARALPGESGLLRRNLYATYVKLKEFDKAYAVIFGLINPMSAPTKAKDLYDMALVAVATGHGVEGRELLEMARLKAPADDAKLLHDIAEFQQVVPPGQ